MCLYFPNAVVFSLPFLKDCPQSESDFSTTLVCQISNRKYVRKSKIVSWIGAFSLKRAGNKFLEIPKKSTKFFSLGPTQNPLVVTPYGFDPHHRHQSYLSGFYRLGIFCLADIFFPCLPSCLPLLPKIGLKFSQNGRQPG